MNDVIETIEHNVRPSERAKARPRRAVCSSDISYSIVHDNAEVRSPNPHVS